MIQNRNSGRDKFGGGDLHVKRGKAGQWLDNFWYHHKWHVIFTALGVFAVLFLTLSMCRRSEPDYYFYYVGPGEFSGNQQRAIISSLSKRSGEDGDDADVAVSFLFLMTDDQIRRYGAEHADDGVSVQGALIGQNRDLLDDEIKTGNAVIFFMDPDILAETQADSGAFLEIRRFAPDGTPDEAFSGDCGIKLRYTVFAADPAFAAFPEGTVIAIRNGVSALALLQHDKMLQNRARYEALLKRWLVIE